ncbi:unnamed protein product [Coccothraustes coccothraustes]
MLAEVVGRMVPLLSSLYFILSFPKSLCSRLHPSLAGLIGCEIAFLPRRQQPPPVTQGLPPKMVGSGAAEAAPPGPGGGYRSNLARYGRPRTCGPGGSRGGSGPGAAGLVMAGAGGCRWAPPDASGLGRDVCAGTAEGGLDGAAARDAEGPCVSRRGCRPCARVLPIPPPVPVHQQGSIIRPQCCEVKKDKKS